MTYLELLRALEERLGRLHMPLRTHTPTVHELFDGCALHHELMVALVRAVYTGNHCQHVRDRITAEATLEAIAPIRAAILHADNTDIDTYRFVEAFLGAVQDSIGRRPAPRPVRTAARGKVIAFRTRRRLRLRRRPSVILPGYRAR